MPLVISLIWEASKNVNEPLNNEWRREKTRVKHNYIVSRVLRASGRASGANPFHFAVLRDIMWIVIVIAFSKECVLHMPSWHARRCISWEKRIGTFCRKGYVKTIVISRNIKVFCRGSQWPPKPSHNSVGGGLEGFATLPQQNYGKVWEATGSLDKKP
jgi:hypothetical protein